MMPRRFIRVPLPSRWVRSSPRSSAMTDASRPCDSYACIEYCTEGGARNRKNSRKSGALPQAFAGRTGHGKAPSRHRKGAAETYAGCWLGELGEILVQPLGRVRLLDLDVRFVDVVARWLERLTLVEDAEGEFFFGQRQ